MRLNKGTLEMMGVSCMKKTAMIAALFLLLTAIVASSAWAAEGTTAAITGGTPNSAALFPFGEDQGLAMQYLDSEHLVELLLLDESGVQQSIRFPCERGNFYFVPSTRENPEFLVYQAEDNALIWYAWKEDGLLALRQWELEGHVLPRIKQEGLLLIKSQAGMLTKTLEFVDMQQQTLLTMDAPKANAVYDDVVFTGNGWILLAREDITNRYALQCVGPAGDLLWTLDLPDVQDVDGLFPDGAGGLWLSHSPTYTGPMILCHVNASGAMNHQLELSGAPRVKHLYCGQILDAGKVILYGTAVANSKGIYHAFSLTLGSDGASPTLEVRNYSQRRDYSITVEQSATGAVYVDSSLYEDAAPMLVPFYSLQVVEDHGLSVFES